MCTLPVLNSILVGFNWVLIEFSLIFHCKTWLSDVRWCICHAEEKSFRDKLLSVWPVECGLFWSLLLSPDLWDFFLSSVRQNFINVGISCKNCIFRIDNVKLPHIEFLLTNHPTALHPFYFKEKTNRSCIGLGRNCPEVDTSDAFGSGMTAFCSVVLSGKFRMKRSPGLLLRVILPVLPPGFADIWSRVWVFACCTVPASRVRPVPRHSGWGSTHSWQHHSQRSVQLRGSSLTHSC